jgi:hypothetical protein
MHFVRKCMIFCNDLEYTPVRYEIKKLVDHSQKETLE